MFFWAIVLIVVAAALAASWYRDRHRRFIRSGGDGFGNHSEQRFLEEDHGVAMSGPHSGAQAAAGRESNEKGLGYWGR